MIIARLGLLLTVVAAAMVAAATSQSSTTTTSDSSSSSYTLPTPSELIVHDLDQVVEAFGMFDGTMYSGSLPMDHTSTTIKGANPDGLRTGYLQFWLFVPYQQAATNTLSAWFNGGPGCSSFSAGILFEHSPVTVPLHEAGWCCESQNETLTENKFGWTHATTMLYVEQPIGVGFSESTNDTPDPSSEDDVAADFDAFLQTFYKVFNGYDSNDDNDNAAYDPSIDFRHHKLSLVGESYAGIYIPSVARQIYLNNVANLPNLDDSPRHVVPLYGIAIGNGKIDALTQDPAVIDYAYWHGLIDGPSRNYLYAEWDHCITNLEQQQQSELISNNNDNDKMTVVNTHRRHEPKPFHSFTVRDDCGILNAVIQAAGGGVLEGTLLEGGPNIYEYSTWDGYAAADGDEGTVSKFYNNPKVQQALNVPFHRRSPHHKWQGCIPEVDPTTAASAAPTSGENNNNNDKHRRLGQQQQHEQQQRRRLENFMAHDTPWSVTPYIAQLLDEANVQVLIYSGDRDIICCTQGSEDALRSMDWSGTRESATTTTGADATAVPATPDHNAWTASPRGLWLYNDYPAGYVKSYKNLSLVSVYNAGHMVPYNQPGPALDMLTRFLKGDSFYDRPLKTYSDRTLPIDGTTPIAAQKRMNQHQTENQQEASLYEASVMPNSTSIFVGSSGMSIGFIAIVALTAIAAVSIAFLFGVWTGQGGQRRNTTQQQNSSSERQSFLGSGGGEYGSVSSSSSVRSSRRGWTTVPFQQTPTTDSEQR